MKALTSDGRMVDYPTWVHRGLSVTLRHSSTPGQRDRTWTPLNIKTGASEPRARKQLSA